jgi:porin
MPWMVVGGLIYRGLIPGRDDDVTTFVATWGRFGDDVRDFQRANNQPLQHYEIVLEFNYRVDITGGFFIQPDIQGVIMPKGLSATPDALVLSLNFGFAL